jgi:16S rRNA (adenine1518-N6/adenine1519-N6)-dimethyltransferase
VLTQTDIRALLQAHDARPKKALGQNFLIDHNLLRKLLDAASIEHGDVVLEVGPGPGVLTEPLLERGARVVACELDDTLAAICAERLADRFPDHLTLITADCLESKRRVNPRIVRALDEAGALDPDGHGFSLVANLPYACATPLIMTLLPKFPTCAQMHVTIQKEVADRLIAAPGSRAYAELSVVAASLAEMRLIAAAGPHCFWPRPKVTSAMLSVIRRDEPLTRDVDRLVRCAHELFTQRRKQIGGLIGRDVSLPEGIDPDQRAEELTPRQLIALAESLDRWAAPPEADELENADAA